MAQQLPLKLRVDIRDLWDGSSSAVKKSVAALTETLGQEITPEVEWQALWSETGDKFPQKDTFVPNVVMIVTAWNERLLSRLENDIYARWTEQLLEALSESKNKVVKLHVQPSGPTPDRPTTEWNPKASSFVIKVPKAPPSSLSAVTSSFENDFEKFFGAKPKEEAWAHVVQTETGSPAVLSPAAVAAPIVSPVVERLPTLEMLQRPEELLRTLSPHILIVDVKFNNGMIVVQCSHQASLELLAGYLQKWGRKNPHSSRWPNMLKVEMVDSDYAFGVQDSLLIHHADDRRTINPTIVLAFVEGILGYKMVHTSGGYWVYRLEKKFV